MYTFDCPDPICYKTSNPSSRDLPPSPAALRPRYISNNPFGGYDPWINASVVVPHCSDPDCIKSNHAMHYVAAFFETRIKDHISALDLPTVVRKNFEEISGLEDRVHAGSRVGNVCGMRLHHVTRSGDDL